MKFIINTSFTSHKLNGYKLMCLLMITLVLALSGSCQESYDDGSEYNIEVDLGADFEKEFKLETENVENNIDEFNFMEMRSKISNTAKNSTLNLNDPKADLSGYLSVSNSNFANAEAFPSIKTNSKFSVDFQNLMNNFLVNNAFPDPDLKNNQMFFFRFKNGIIFFTNKKDSISILGSFKPKQAENNQLSNPQLNATQSCFNVVDESEMVWNLCAATINDKNKWLCSLEDYTGSYTDNFCGKNEPQNRPTNATASNANSTASNQTAPVKRVKNLLIIPQESRKCNDNWNYDNKGQDWECTCADGLSQSPIDLPAKSLAKQTKLKPLFIYERILPISKENSIDGLLVQNESIKIYYKNNALRIFHTNLGKIVLPDGGVYIGEEIVFHTPAEHTIGGKKYDMEVQIIHYGRSKGDIAKQVVLSFLFYMKPGIFNKFFDRIDIYNLPNQIDTFKDLTEKFFIPELFYRVEDTDVDTTKDFSFYYYEGSLTFPPCTERTKYFIAANPIPISNTIISLFKEALTKPDYVENGKIIKSFDRPRKNNRKIQPLNGRKVFVYQSPFKGLNK